MTQIHIDPILRSSDVAIQRKTSIGKKSLRKRMILMQGFDLNHVASMYNHICNQLLSPVTVSLPNNTSSDGSMSGAKALATSPPGSYLIGSDSPLVSESGAVSLEVVQLDQDPAIRQIQEHILAQITVAVCQRSPLLVFVSAFNSRMDYPNFVLLSDYYYLMGEVDLQSPCGMKLVSRSSAKYDTEFNAYSSIDYQCWMQLLSRFVFLYGEHDSKAYEALNRRANILAGVCAPQWVGTKAPNPISKLSVVGTPQPEELLDIVMNLQETEAHHLSRASSTIFRKNSRSNIHTGLSTLERKAIINAYHQRQQNQSLNGKSSMASFKPSIRSQSDSAPGQYTDYHDSDNELNKTSLDLADVPAIVVSGKNNVVVSTSMIPSSQSKSQLSQSVSGRNRAGSSSSAYSFGSLHDVVLPMANNTRLPMASQSQNHTSVTLHDLPRRSASQSSLQAAARSNLSHPHLAFSSMDPNLHSTGMPSYRYNSSRTSLLQAPLILPDVVEEDEPMTPWTEEDEQYSDVVESSHDQHIQIEEDLESPHVPSRPTQNAHDGPVRKSSLSSRHTNQHQSNGPPRRVRFSHEDRLVTLSASSEDYGGIQYANDDDELYEDSPLEITSSADVTDSASPFEYDSPQDVPEGNQSKADAHHRHTMYNHDSRSCPSVNEQVDNTEEPLSPTDSVTWFNEQLEASQNSLLHARRSNNSSPDAVQIVLQAHEKRLQVVSGRSEIISYTGQEIIQSNWSASSRNSHITPTNPPAEAQEHFDGVLDETSEEDDDQFVYSEDDSEMYTSEGDEVPNPSFDKETPMTNKSDDPVPIPSPLNVPEATGLDDIELDDDLLDNLSPCVVSPNELLTAVEEQVVEKRIFSNDYEIDEEEDDEILGEELSQPKQEKEMSKQEMVREPNPQPSRTGELTYQKQAMDSKATITSGNTRWSYVSHSSATSTIDEEILALPLPPKSKSSSLATPPRTPPKAVVTNQGDSVKRSLSSGNQIKRIGFLKPSTLQILEDVIQEESEGPHSASSVTSPVSNRSRTSSYLNMSSGSIISPDSSELATAVVHRVGPAVVEKVIDSAIKIPPRSPMHSLKSSSSSASPGRVSLEHPSTYSRPPHLNYNTMTVKQDDERSRESMDVPSPIPIPSGINSSVNANGRSNSIMGPPRSSSMGIVNVHGRTSTMETSSGSLSQSHPSGGNNNPLRHLGSMMKFSDRKSTLKTKRTSVIPSSSGHNSLSRPSMDIAEERDVGSSRRDSTLRRVTQSAANSFSKISKRISGTLKRDHSYNASTSQVDLTHDSVPKRNESLPRPHRPSISMNATPTTFSPNLDLMPLSSAVSYKPEKLSQMLSGKQVSPDSSDFVSESPEHQIPSARTVPTINSSENVSPLHEPLSASKSGTSVESLVLPDITSDLGFDDLLMEMDIKF